MTVRITILGLGQIGTSIGLALAAHKEKVYRVGTDREPEVAKTANKLGALDQLNYNLPSAVAKADVVILALPIDEIRPTLEIIVPDLKAGVVVINTSPLQVKAIEWAKELLPAERHFVNMTPVINPIYLEEQLSGVDAAHADLFKNGLMIITHAADADADALKLAADLTSLLDSTPFFADPLEADGLLAASYLLPRLAAAALANAVIHQPGWGEGRKLAGKAFATATLPTEEMDEVKGFGLAALNNRDNVLRVLDDLAEELRLLREAIAAGDEKALSDRLKSAREDRKTWRAQRLSGNFSDQPKNSLPTSGEIFGRIFLGKRKNSS